MAVDTEPRCELCGSTEGVLRRRLHLMDVNRQAQIDACAECRRTKTLEVFEEFVLAAPAGRRIHRTVVSEEEIAKATTKRRRRVVKR